MERSASMLERLNSDLSREEEDVAETEQSADRLAELAETLWDELKATKRQRIRDIMKHPDQEELLEETYDEMEAELQKKIEGLNHQIALLSDRRNTILQVNRAAKTAMDVFEDILKKEKLERSDLELLIDGIRVYRDHIEVQLKSDIDSLLRCGRLEEPKPCVDSGELAFRVVQSALNHPDRVFRVNVDSEGDPLEIYTDRDGEVIFKKYSLMNGLGESAAQLCETLHKSTGRSVLITDRDTIIALSGLPRRELLEKRVSLPLEHIMEGRQIYQRREENAPVPVSELSADVNVLIAAPILSEGDVMGSVVFAGGPEDAPLGETEYKLAQTISGFLGRHMES
jgi:stage V sporulation protein T